MKHSKLVRKYKRCFFNSDDKTAIKLIIKHPWLCNLPVKYSNCTMFLLDIEHNDNTYVELTFLHKRSLIKKDDFKKVIRLEIREKNS